MASTPITEVVVKKRQLPEIKAALEMLDNPNSGTDDGGKEKPRRYKYKQASETRYLLSMAFREVFEHFRIVDKVRRDLVRLHMDDQAKEFPDASELIGRRNQAAIKEIETMWEEDVTLRLRQIPIGNLDLENNAIPFTAVGILLGNVIVTDEQSDGEDG